MLHDEEFGIVNNSEVQKLCDDSKTKATRYLNELEEDFIEKNRNNRR